MNAPFRPALLAAPRCRLADPGEPGVAARIERYLASTTRATVFHEPRWLNAVSAGTGNRALALVAERGGEMCGYLPLVEAHSPIFGRILASSGFAVGGGILADDAVTARELAAAAEELALRRSASAVELRGGDLPAGRAGWTVSTSSHAGFVAPLAPDDEAQLLAIPRKQRAEVRKGLAHDLTVEIGTAPADRAAHYAVYAQSVRNLGTPVFPRALFDTVMDALDADILTVRAGGVPVASVLSLYHRGSVMPYWGGGTRAARGLRANDRMYFELMRHARARGCTRFDFGRSKTGSGPFHFKRNWGFEPEPLAYATWAPPGTALRDANPLSPKRARQTALWQKLPLTIANRIGPWIARGLA